MSQIGFWKCPLKYIPSKSVTNHSEQGKYPRMFCSHMSEVVITLTLTFFFVKVALVNYLYLLHCLCWSCIITSCIIWKDVPLNWMDYCGQVSYRISKIQKSIISPVLVQVSGARNLAFFLWWAPFLDCLSWGLGQQLWKSYILSYSYFFWLQKWKLRCLMQSCHLHWLSVLVSLPQLHFPHLLFQVALLPHYNVHCTANSCQTCC